NRVFDSGSAFEKQIAAQVPSIFNLNGEDIPAGIDNRSDNKGPEPEGVTVGVINGKTYAFIGLERTGGIMVYDVTNPQSPQFIEYVPNATGDLAPEGLKFIPASDSPNGKDLLIVANEVSKTIAVYEVNLSNNLAPTALTLSATNVNETVPANTVIGTFSTIDPNQGDTFTYSFANGGNDNSFFTINGNSLIINQSPDFQTKSNYFIRVVTTDQGGLSFEEDLVIGVNDILDSQTQLLNPKNDVFNITGVNVKVKLKVKLLGRNSNLVNELGVYSVDDQNGTINGIAPGAAGYAEAALARSQAIFSIIANNPNGFDPNNLSRLLEFDSNQNFRFYLIKNSTLNTVKQTSSTSNILFSNTSVQQITSLTAGSFTLGWTDGSNNTNVFNDLVVNITATDETPIIGAGLQGIQAAEVIDLRSFIGGVSATFTVNREAAFDNFVGFYQVTGENGGIDINNDGVADLLPGQAGYIQAAINQRLAGVNLTVDNQATANYTGTFSGGGIFAPFMIVNGRPEALLDTNGSNDPAVYFPYLGANPNQVDHIRLLGDNVFGFEDLPGGGDGDYNDVIVRVGFNTIF
ncbi:choice-of-anchor I domain-containing protein, partial [Anabaena sp. UHCC 0399]|uniref:choice-of-anchor I domain-containing protein n=1 Tax=Anabaena sp. UHCC 0399 TaxID=3110238 RepID=UPI002B1EAD66